MNRRDALKAAIAGPVAAVAAWFGVKARAADLAGGIVVPPEFARMLCDCTRLDGPEITVILSKGLERKLNKWSDETPLFARGNGEPSCP